MQKHELSTKYSYFKQNKTVFAIAKYGKLSEQLIYSFLFVENQNFDSNAISSANAIGLMQIKQGTANDAIILANKSNLLSNFDKLLLITLLGNLKYNQIINTKILGTNQVIKAKDLKNPELNLLVGCIFLKVLSKECKGDLATIGLRYYNGYFAFNHGKNISADSLQNSAYVIKLQNKFNSFYHV